MSSQPSKNEGVRIIAQFQGKTVSLSDAKLIPDDIDGRKRSMNEGVSVIAEFKDSAQPFAAPPTQDQTQVATVFAKIEIALQAIQVALAEIHQFQIKQSQSAQIQSKAG
jgi:hypothetical protein